VLPAGRKRIQELTRKYLDEILAKGDDIVLAKQLYGLLLSPLPQEATSERLIVVPDGILHLLPFDTLHDSTGALLLETRTISYAPASTVLSVLRTTKDTEGFGPQKFHGRVVVLVNEHTASAGEMVAAFAEENQLATIVGTKTPGRLLSGSAFKAGFGYIVGLPVAAYLTWEGRLIEGKGVSPNIPVALSPEQLLAGEDPQMQKALELVRAL
jgi:CHAT domain-containing protein